MYIVKVDRDSVKRNPEAGSQGPYFVRGSSGYQQMWTLSRQPTWLFKYSDCQVTCGECGETFSYKDLTSEDVEEYCDACGMWSEYTRSNICPKCGELECVELDYEDIDSVVKELGLQ